MRADISLLEARASDIEDAANTAKAALSAVIPPDVIEALQPSVYLIVVNGAAKATAFVVDRENGVLATAAHSADGLPLDDPDSSVYIINRNTGKKLPVTGRRLHRGFGAFRQIVESYQPIRKDSSIYTPRVTRVRDLAFDAGWIIVEPTDPDTGENLLGPDLVVASDETLFALKPGAPIAIIGYPYDTLDDGFAPDAAIPRAERGVIAAMTPPLDFAALPQNPVTANLIIHRLSTAGGNSGSPIINANGDVIGIHSHGIESRSSNADGAAQRADIIHDLKDADREQRRLETIFKPAWRNALANWARADEALAWSFYYEYARPNIKPPPTVGAIDYQAAPPFNHRVVPLSYSKESSSRRVDYRPSPSKMNVEDQADDQTYFLIEEKGQYAEITFAADRNKETVLYAFDYSLFAGNGICPIKTFWRKQDEDRLTINNSRASFELYLPATDEGSQTYQLIFQRNAQCDPISDEFFAGMISWENTPQPSLAALSEPNTLLGASEAMDVGSVRFKKLFNSTKSRVDCILDPIFRGENCYETEYIELQNK